jgi:hypothetical protein
MSTPPEVRINGLTFLPVPDFRTIPGPSHYFNRHDLPEVPQKFLKEVDRLFFDGGKYPEFGADVDPEKAKRAIKALLSSWAPPHEAKTATVAYAIWVWSPEAAKARADTQTADLFAEGAKP